MFSFIAAYLNCVKAQGKVCRIQTISFLGNIFSFSGAGLKLCESVIFRKMFSFIAVYLNCVKARGKVCRIQTTSFLGIMFSFIGTGLKLHGRVIFRI